MKIAIAGAMLLVLAGCANNATRPQEQSQIQVQGRSAQTNAGTQAAPPKAPPVSKAFAKTHTQASLAGKYRAFTDTLLLDVTLNQNGSAVATFYAIEEPDVKPIKVSGKWRVDADHVIMDMKGKISPGRWIYQYRDSLTPTDVQCKGLPGLKAMEIAGFKPMPDYDLWPAKSMVGNKPPCIKGTLGK